MLGRLREILAAGRGPDHGRAGITGQVGTITRSDGTTQATYDGHPLYTFVGDKAPGKNTGNGLNVSGGLWWEMTDSGSTPPAKAAAAAAKVSSSPKATAKPRRQRRLRLLKARALRPGAQCPKRRAASPTRRAAPAKGTKSFPPNEFRPRPTPTTRLAPQ